MKFGPSRIPTSVIEFKFNSSAEYFKFIMRTFQINSVTMLNDYEEKLQSHRYKTKIKKKIYAKNITLILKKNESFKRTCIKNIIKFQLNYKHS